MPSSVSGVRPAAPASPDAALRQASQQLAGVFVQEMLKVMRQTVPESGGLTDRSQGEEVFTSLMDERVASETSEQWSRGLADAIHRALRPAASPVASSAAVAPLSPSDAPRA